MEEVLKALNGLVEDSIVSGYAIGGAIGASFYVAALQTEDVDAFLILPESNSAIALISSIYQNLIARGGVVEGAHVRFGKWPLQVLTDANELLREAIREAAKVPYAGIQTRIFRAEYLLAVALQTGRTKDFARVELMLEQDVVSRHKLHDILSRYGLLERFENRFGQLR